MSPAGYWPQLRAAIEAGADAVYFGLKQFSARAKVGFEVAELPEVLGTLHERGVKGFVTFNTLVFDRELADAEKAIVNIAESGADAIIVQDIAIAKLAREIAPQLEVHGSTQMSVTSAQGAQFAKQLGCSRVVLGRELSLKDIEKICQATDVQLEVFVHGALCVSYSGQCFSSEAWGGRSANRGQCAQACRLSYDLVVDGQVRDLGDSRYLLSPGDLYALEQIPELVRLGIACVKIEGRYKDANYVALTTKAYRQAIDSVVNNVETEFDQTVQRDQLQQIYSRGLGPHFMSGVNHQTVVEGRAPRHRGQRVGKVLKVTGERVVVQVQHDIRPGDGLVFDAADWRSPDEPEEGGNVYEVKTTDTMQTLAFGNGQIDFTRIRPGDLVWRTSDPQLLVQLKPLANPKKIQFTRPLNLQVFMTAGQPLKVTGRDESGQVVSVSSRSDLQVANKQGLDRQKLVEQFSRLGGTPFHLGTMELNQPADQSLFLPVKELNELRRALVAEMLERRRQTGTNRQTSQGVVQNRINAIQSNRPLSESAQDQSLLHLLVRDKEQLAAAIEQRPASITLDYLELYGLRESVELIQSAGISARVASPRILKPAEQKVIRFLLSLECAIVIRSAGLMHDLLQAADQDRPQLIGDFSLNAANAISVADLLELGLQRVTPTYDLNAQQIQNLCQSIAPAQLEIVAFSHLPVFHTEHCVFCRFLSSGTDNTNCGHPCETHRVSLRDHSGRAHPVVADVGCRNTVFGAEAQVAPTAISMWQKAGLRHFRAEFVHESAEQVAAISAALRKSLNKEISGHELETQLKRICTTGITKGSLFVPQADS